MWKSFTVSYLYFSVYLIGRVSSQDQLTSTINNGIFRPTEGHYLARGISPILDPSVPGASQEIPRSPHSPIYVSPVTNSITSSDFPRDREDEPAPKLARAVAIRAPSPAPERNAISDSTEHASTNGRIRRQLVGPVDTPIIDPNVPSLISPDISPVITVPGPIDTIVSPAVTDVPVLPDIDPDDIPEIYESIIGVDLAPEVETALQALASLVLPQLTSFVLQNPALTQVPPLIPLPSAQPSMVVPGITSAVAPLPTAFPSDISSGVLVVGPSGGLSIFEPTSVDAPPTSAVDSLQPIITSAPITSIAPISTEAAPSAISDASSDVAATTAQPTSAGGSAASDASAATESNLSAFSTETPTSIASSEISSTTNAASDLQTSTNAIPSASSTPTSISPPATMPPDTDTSSSSSSDQESGLSSGAIAGIAAGSATVLLVVIVIVAILFRRRAITQHRKSRPVTYPEVAFLYDPPVPPVNASTSASAFATSNTSPERRPSERGHHEAHTLLSSSPSPPQSPESPRLPAFPTFAATRAPPLHSEQSHYDTQSLSGSSSSGSLHAPFTYPRPLSDDTTGAGTNDSIHIEDAHSVSLATAAAPRAIYDPRFTSATDTTGTTTSGGNWAGVGVLSPPLTQPGYVHEGWSLGVDRYGEQRPESMAVSVLSVSPSRGNSGNDRSRVSGIAGEYEGIAEGPHARKMS